MKYIHKIILSIGIILSLLMLVSAIELTTRYNPWTGKLDYISNGNFSGSNVTANFILGNMSWNYLFNYPVACPSGSAITQLDDSVTCTTFAEYEFGNNNFNGSGNITTSEWFNGLFNWTSVDDWNIFDGSSLSFNESKLSSIYYNATQSQLVRGTIDGGSLVNTQHPDAKYDGITLNFSEESGSPGLDIRINFTGVEGFNRGVMRYKTSGLSGDYPVRQLWNYLDNYGIMIQVNGILCLFLLRVKILLL